MRRETEANLNISRSSEPNVPRPKEIGEGRVEPPENNVPNRVELEGEEERPPDSAKGVDIPVPNQGKELGSRYGK